LAKLLAVAANRLARAGRGADPLLLDVDNTLSDETVDLGSFEFAEVSSAGGRSTATDLADRSAGVAC
jgi:hypothetical protein